MKATWAPYEEIVFNHNCFKIEKAALVGTGKLLGQVTGTQCLLEVHLLVASLQEQLGFQG